MDEAFLNDLLECCVCLKQLDNSSKVLPCQHTFCKHCLHEIFNSHKELRCPKCRILVDAKIEELPCNILLIRLLEGIKNVRLKKVGGSVDIAPQSAESSSSSQQQTPPHPQLPQLMWNERINNSFSSMVELGKVMEKCEESIKCFIMDEAFLNDLLECCVCLEPLDNSSKVLPCQHTFCKRCLHEILNTHKELRCPECRMLVDAKIEELPCNTLLICLLEGIKNVRLKKDFDLCISCNDKDGHDCEMEDSSACDTNLQELKESKLLLIQRCIKFLVHASQCRDANCRLPSCQKMKKIIKHARSCKQPKTRDRCSICNQLIALCCYHAKYCQEAGCLVPFCFIIKDKLKHQQLQHGLQARILKRRTEIMQNHGVLNAVPQTSPGYSNSSSQPSHLPQSGIDMMPSSGPPVGALQAVQQVQASAARQTTAHMVAASSYGKVNPVVIPPVANTGLKTAINQMQKPIPQAMSGVSNRMLNVGNVACWKASGYAQNSQPHQNSQPQPVPQLGFKEQAYIIGPGSIPNSIGNSSMGPPQVIPNSEPTLGGVQRHTQIAWQQFVQTMESPNTPEKHQKALGILKSNPELMAMFIKQKTASYQRQQQLRQQMIINEGNIITPSPQNVWQQQQQQQHRQQQFLVMQQQQPNEYPHPQSPLHSKRPRMENPYEF